MGMVIRTHLCLINTILLFLVLGQIGMLNFLQKRIPIYRPQSWPEPVPLKLEQLDLPVEQLYGRRDIFGLYEKVSTTAVKEDWSKKIPKVPDQAPLVIPERPKGVVMQDPLPIVLDGIVWSANPEASMCVFSEEGAKEKFYHVYDQVKDGVILKIDHKQVIILRSNGQLETYYLHGHDPALEINFKDLVLALDEQHYVVRIDSAWWKDMSLAEFLQPFGLVPVFKDGKAVDMRVTACADQSFPQLLGLKLSDKLLSLDGCSLLEKSGRKEAYLRVISAHAGKEMVLELLRNDKPLSITYRLDEGNIRLNQAQHVATSAVEMAPNLAPANIPAVSSAVPNSNIVNTVNSQEVSAVPNTNMWGGGPNQQLYQQSLDAIRQDLLNKVKRMPR